MYNKRFTLALCAACCFMSCQKDDIELPPPVDDLPALQYLVRSIEFDDGTVARVNYHSDSTIRDIYYNNQSAAGMVEFTWSGKQASTVSYYASLYRDTIQYTNGRLTSISHNSKTGTSPSSYSLEYSYNANGSLGGMQYYRTNEAGRKLVTSTVYAYSANGDLAAITTTQKSNQYVIKLTIDGWSAPCEINPWLFTGPSLSENYTLYNYPILRSLKKMPVKVTKSVQAVGQAAEVEKIDVNAYTITNKRLDKTVTSLTYPKHPDLDQSFTTLYKY